MTAAMQPALLMGESVRFQTQFTPHMILTYLKTTVTVTDRRVIVHHPHQLFGVIPYGYLQKEVPLRHVAQISSGSATSTIRILFALAVFCFAIGVIFLGREAVDPGSILFGIDSRGALGVLFGLILLAIAVVLFMTAHSNGIFVYSTGGGVLVANGARSEMPHIQHTAAELGRLIFS
ncbi:hypothetical protein HGA04_04870 [Gordonia rubripertincta]|nr:hypothetical protein [Gordonia rubripertincta]NKY62009.1 hypothetical protein [Gordonia rubripertincta]